MKKLTYFFAALVAVALLATSCKPKDNPDSGKNAYALSAFADVDKSHKDADKMRPLVEEALRSAGFLLKGYDLILDGDSAAVASQLATKMQVVETAIKESKSNCPVEITVRGMLKQDLEKENRHVCLFYYRNFGAPKDDVDVDGLTHIHMGHWVKYLRTQGFWDSGAGDYYTEFGRDVNSGVGGDYVYVVLEHSGKYDDDFAFEWEDQYADTYLTDVIAIYGGGEPQEITIEGRTYHKQNQVCDLNHGSGGEYVYLYGTTDPVPGYEGYYLNTGALNDDGLQQCRMLSANYHFDAKDHLSEPFTWGGHRFVERVVQAYWTDGTYAEELNTNKGHGDHKRIRFILTYANHDTFDYAHWTEALPGSTRLADMTIPGLHDAATWMTGWNSPINSIVKDQDLDYATAWNLGARAFDMRLGYSSASTFADGCAFYHGNEGDLGSRLNNFNDDIPNHFPTKEQLSSSFMLIFEQIENDPDEAYINIFEYFMRLLIDRYGADSFMEYREGLTLDDVKGKILIFVYEDELTKDYSHIGGLTQVPINQLNTNASNPVSLNTFVNGQPSHTYNATVQNKWPVQDANEKYNCIMDVLNQPVPQFLLNQFNSTSNNVIPESWPISRKVNRWISNDLAKDPLPSQYQRPLGVVLFDLCGVENEVLTDGTSIDFAGLTLIKSLVKHNFRNQ